MRVIHMELTPLRSHFGSQITWDTPLLPLDCWQHRFLAGKLNFCPKPPHIFFLWSEERPGATNIVSLIYMYMTYTHSNIDCLWCVSVNVTRGKFWGRNANLSFLQVAGGGGG